MKQSIKSQSNNQPVAYDANGLPLYHHPAKSAKKSDKKVEYVHISKSYNPETVDISDDVKLKHDRSVKAYPDLNLSEGEYVISEVSRNPLGLVAPMSAGIFLVILTFVFLFNLDSFVGIFRLDKLSITASSLVIPTVLFATLVLIGVYISYYVFKNNRFFLTNESIIQQIQYGLFSKREQTVSLSNIEDASYTQNGIIEQIFNYGSIRLSTEGDETTYRFSYADNPKYNVSILNNAIEAFKNGHPFVND